MNDRSLVNESSISRPLWWCVGLPFLALVVAGSLALTGSLYSLYSKDARSQFRSTANAAAYFIKLGRIPTSPLLAEHLQTLMGVDVYFAHGESIEPSPAHDWAAPFRAHRRPWEIATLLNIAAGRDIVAIDLDEWTTLVLDRPRPSALNLLWRPMTAVVLGAFWAGALGLGWFVARRVVHPINQLTVAVSRLQDNDDHVRLPGREREDEIGQLSRSLEATHARRVGETALRQRAERAAVLGRMATGLAHEIKNPLAAVRMHADLIQDSVALPERASRSLEHIQRETDRIRDLVDQRLYLARPDAPAITTVNLSELAQSAIERWRPMAETNGITLDPDLQDSMPSRGDTARLEQVLSNIVLNAIQVMPEGGSLCVKGRRLGDAWELAFLDSGPGFTSSALRRATELFYSEREGGLGIGLGLAREIIEKHGGGLSLRNRVTGGADVRVRLPAVVEVT
jgi:signal transduction histidine kinase